ncbi:aldo/keto reductase [Crocosphaera sp. Alani8]|uniref:aldo/keto reductase n=1 Tax=Crocosphaera sp. Alani8 TaxID=3038952 RepID=UPI00313B23FC
MKISGKATKEGTQRYRERHLKNCHQTFFNEVGELTLSSLGIGTYNNRLEDHSLGLVTKAIEESIRSGINMIDSAICYAQEKAECSIRDGIRNLLELGEVSRDELVICTKGGVLPHPKENHVECVEWFAQNYVEPSRFSIDENDLVNTAYCMHPEYLQDQLDRSLVNLGVETIDIYYIHNPEVQLLKFAPDVFYDQLRKAFEVMEDAVASGKIGAYGLATWRGFRLSPTSKRYLDLQKIKSIAQEVAATRNKKDKFQFIQLPINMIMLEALVLPTQKIDGEAVSILEAASRLNIFPVASNSIDRQRLNKKVPKHIFSDFDNNLKTDYQRKLQYTRSTPHLSSALVGMTKMEHVRENLALKKISSIEKKKFFKITRLIERSLLFHHSFKTFFHYITTILTGIGTPLKSLTR